MKARTVIMLTGSALVGVSLAAAVFSMKATTASASAGAGAVPIATRAADSVSALDKLGSTSEDLSLSTSLQRQIAATVSVAPGVAESMNPGEYVPGTFRTLRTGLGGSARILYGFKTTKTRVCVGITRGPSGCVEGFPKSTPFTYTFGDPDGPDGAEAPIIYGLAQDGVTSVEATVAGVHVSTPVVNNTYFIQFDNAALPISDGIVITANRDDGSRATVKVGGQ